MERFNRVTASRRAKGWSDKKAEESNLVIDPDFRDPFFRGDRHNRARRLSFSLPFFSLSRERELRSSEDQRGERERCSSFRFLIIDAATMMERKACRDFRDESSSDRLDGGIDVVSSRAGFPRFHEGI